MDEQFIARLIALVERSGIAELELSQGGARLRIVKSPGGGAAQTAVETGAPDAAASPAEQAPPEPRRHVVRAGFPGTFFRASAPGQPPFVGVGDRVEDGQQLAILEAMKTMNPLEADCAGKLAETPAEDGAAVEAGAALFVIEADA
ncbi:MAG TPA: biotin/lipoyl-containing protein [Mesorhizobium sp.]|jgi:acetyl-CoA carboxylase biotin carboxyl carrier protein|nr:biotin/lipoyl-containing protein [Mesorhizobium sp.]